MRNIKTNFLIVLGVILLIACNNVHIKKEIPLIVRNAEARDDSIEMRNALNRQAKIKFAVHASAETLPVESLEGEDAADDPAIWVNPSDPEKSLVLGTNKKHGMYVYDLEGKTKQYIDCGQINNVDLRSGFDYNGREVTIVAGSNRSSNTISLFILDPDSAKLSNMIANIPSKVSEVYGFCMYHNTSDNKFYAIVNGKDFKIEQWYLEYANDSIYYELVRSYCVTSQLEGMVSDDTNNTLYYAIEQEGIFKVDLMDESITPRKLAGSDSLNKDIAYDIEGIALFNYHDQKYLLASSQGSFSYAIFKLGETDNYIGSFKIIDDIVDGVEETDGLEVVNVPLGSCYPKGLIVVQDGFNYDGDSLRNQNFKYISFESIIPILSNK